MPAITLGLAEVEERLRVLRRRLNAFTLQHVAYLSASTVVLVVAALIVTGLRGSALAFRALLWSGAALSIAVVSASVLVGRQRWLDLQGTAHLADRRGGLTDRLTTLVDPRVRVRPSRLAPVLVAQTLALGASWRPEFILPRRVPRSMFVLVASLLALASTAFLSRRPPLPQPAQTASGAAGVPNAVAGMQASSSLARGAGDAQAGAGAGMQPPANLPMRDAGAEGGAPAGGLPSDQTRSSDAPGSLPDRLQEAIRRAFHAEQMGDPQQLAARSDSGVGGRGEHREGKIDSDEHRTRPGADKPGAQSAGAQKETGKGQQQSGQGKSGEHSPQQSGDAQNQNFDGSSPAAGTGSSPGGLMDAKASGAALGGDGPKTFKVTITSFLRAVEQKGAQQHRSGKSTGTVTAAGIGVGSPTALNQRQLNDDALRKAEIPPEYEDIVRRVYSLRAEQ